MASSLMRNIRTTFFSKGNVNEKKVNSGSSSSAQGSCPQPSIIPNQIVDLSDLDLNLEKDRLKTFETWTVAFQDKNLLAKTGLFFEKQPDTTRCHFCTLKIYEWDLEDDPVKIHYDANPHCPLFRRDRTANVPIDDAQLERILPPVVYDTYGLEEVTQPPRNPRTMYPEYENPIRRLKSYQYWPIGLKQNKDELVDAGFFYTNRGDRVVCFSCGLGLSEWDPNDQPWVEHAKHNVDKCNYLYFVKGEDFVNAVQKDVKKTTEYSKPLTVNSEPITPEESKSIQYSNNVCGICCSNRIDVLFIKCGHVYGCRRCTYLLDKCPICREVSEKMRIYFP